MSRECGCGHEATRHFAGGPSRFTRCADCACQRFTEDARSVPVGDLPDGSRVKAVVHGVIFGQDIRVDSGVRATPNGSRIVFERFPADWCVSVEPVPVVPEPGRWYEASTCHWFALPNGWLIEYDDKGFHVAYPPASIVHMFGPLVECEPPAEFRDGQQ